MDRNLSQYTVKEAFPGQQDSTRRNSSDDRPSDDSPEPFIPERTMIDVKTEYKQNNKRSTPLEFIFLISSSPFTANP
jgi:hypothetical protein